MHLYEAHLPVADTIAAEKFYREVVGLTFAYRDPGRDIVFLWADAREKGMIGLWGPGTTYGRGGHIALTHHLAFAVEFDQLMRKIEELEGCGIETFGFGGEKTREPTVIGWMPSAQIYFRDPDGHLLEFISNLAQDPRPEFIGTYSEWVRLGEKGGGMKAEGGRRKAEG
jgi:lactoylglutathione lyase